MLQVENVQLYGGYVLHMGTAVETIRPGDHLMLFLNKVRQATGNSLGCGAFKQGGYLLSA